MMHSELKGSFLSWDVEHSPPSYFWFMQFIAQHHSSIIGDEKQICVLFKSKAPQLGNAPPLVSCCRVCLFHCTKCNFRCVMLKSDELVALGCWRPYWLCFWMRRNPRKAMYLKVSHPWFSSSLSPHDKPAVHTSSYYGLQKRYGSQSWRQRESMGFTCQLCLRDFCQGTGTFCLVGQIPAAYCVSCVLWSLQINYGRISLHPPKWPFVTLNSWRTRTFFLALPHAKNPTSKKSLNTLK